jgi:glycosyltransferase involved in cell wall biosynthesis
MAMCHGPDVTARERNMQEVPVSIVTPVYNGARFIAECIESALAQTYRHFEYVILDNASTDDTPGIIARYAQRDSRIRVHRNDSTLWVIDNWNRALQYVSPDSRYCKVLHADDTMTPDCLAKLVDVALRQPSAGIIGALRLRGETVECRGLPPRETFPGAEVARLFMRREVFALAPSSGFIRADLVRARRPFYPNAYLHADIAAYLDILATHDFGFVHEVLSFSRKHENSITATVAEKKQTMMKEWLPMLRQYGPKFFKPDELARMEDAFLRRYYRVLIRSAVTGRGWDFWNDHLAGLREAKRAPGFTDLCVAAFAELIQSVSRPGKLYRHLRPWHGR